MSDPTATGAMNQVGSGEEPENPVELHRKVVGAVLLAGALTVVGIWIAVGLANQHTVYRAPDKAIENPVIDTGPDPMLQLSRVRRPPTAEELEIPPLPAGLPFDMSNWSISEDRVLLVGPAKDGVLALTDPKRVEASETDIKWSDQVVCVKVGDEAVAYPKTILCYHMVVNDIVGGQPITVTYYPITDSAVVFNGEIHDQRREFAVTGMVYNSSVLMHDRATDGEDSLWCQMSTSGVTGKFADHELEILPFEVTKWALWKDRHPHTEILSKDTGHDHVYSINPYDTQEWTERSMYPIDQRSDRVPQKDRILGVWTENGSSRAYAFSLFGDNSVEVDETLDGMNYTFIFDRPTYTARLVNADPGIKVAYCWWNAWYGFHPDTEVYGQEDLISRSSNDVEPPSDAEDSVTEESDFEEPSVAEESSEEPSVNDESGDTAQATDSEEVSDQ